MRKTVLLVTVAVALSAPSMAFAKKVKHHAKPVAAPAQQDFVSLNRDNLRALHDGMFFWVPGDWSWLNK